MSSKHQLILVAVGCLVLFTNLGGPQLWDRDEPRNAGCAQEMIARHDWVTPFFNGEPRTAKPVLLYWFIMSAYAVFGVNEFAARFWSAALSIGTTLATYHMGCRLFNPQVGLWAGIILVSTLMFDIAARACTPDAVLIFFSTMAVAVYVFFAFPKEKSLRRVTWFPQPYPAVLLMYGMMGMAALAKGPAGVVLPTAVIGMFMLIMRLPESRPDADGPAPVKPLTDRLVERLARLLSPFAPVHFLRTCWFMRPLTAIGAVLVIAAPWYLWVGSRTNGEWLEKFFIYENITRATTPLENHRGGPFFYPTAIMAGFFPWSIFALPVVVGAVTRIRRREAWSPAYILLACWVGVFVGIFSLAQTKLPSYVTPCYPALALLTGCFVYRWSNGEMIAGTRMLKTGLSILALVGTGILVGLPVAATKFLPGEEWLGVAGIVPLVGAVTCLILVIRAKHAMAARVMAVTAVLFTTSLFGGIATRVSQHQQYQALFDKLPQDEPVRLASFGCLEPSWVFYSGRSIAEFHDASKALQVLQSEPQNFLLTTDEHLPRLASDNLRVVAEVPYFLKDERLLLLEWIPAHAASRSSATLR